MWLNHHNLNRVCAGLAIIVVTGTGHAGSILYVDDDAPAAGDGASWNTAFRFLADALTVADDPKSNVSEIRVGQGTYLPDRDETQPDGSGDREAIFRLINSIVLMGGYAGLGAPDPDARNIELYETILSGDLLGNDEPDFINNDENSYHVVIGNSLDATSIFDGFTISGGNADSTYGQGGGMSNVFCYATIANCTFKSNTATNGGGMYNLFADPIITNCAFTRNSAIEIQDGINRGGGIYNFISSPKITNCVFNGNYVDWWGAAISNGNGSNPAITNCLFSGNIACVDSGGIHNVEDSNPTISNCTFASNESLYVGAVTNGPGCTPSIFNCIIWDNQGIVGQIAGNPANVAYSCVQDGYDGISNIDADPMFVRNPDPGPDMVWGTEDDDYGDLRLMPGSPCIDAGNNWGIPIDADDFDQDGNKAELFPVDLAGSPRFNADEADFDPGCGTPVVIDMGVYEYQFDPVKQIIFADIDGDGAVGISDLIALLASWGDSPGNCLADLDINGNVGTVDLLALFANWGSGG
ncbi:MAG: right-handed parallel beta-helix repeat-containing protein [Planctomycetes bacterium]|nr:right-handed parallel beta-helix repeat-containing protein [Planctomycetota bacterium]